MKIKRKGARAEYNHVSRSYTRYLIWMCFAEFCYKDKLPLLTNNQERNKSICLFNWLDTKLEITEYKGHSITRSELQKYVITNYFDCRYYENIDFVKQILKIYLTFSTKSKIIVVNISMSNLDIKRRFNI